MLLNTHSDNTDSDLHANTNWAAECGQLLQGDQTGKWKKVVSSEQAGVYFCARRQVFVKLFYETKLRQKIKDFVFPQYARHQQFCANTEWLRQHQFNAPKILFHDLIGGIGCVVTEAFPGVGVGSMFARYLRYEDLLALANGHSMGIDKKVTVGQLLRWKRNLAIELGLLVGRLHNAGVMHGDLRPNNIMINCQTNFPQFCLIDNERNKLFFNNVLNRGFIKNLVQLNMMWSADVSATYRLLFLKSYLSVMPISSDKKQLAKKIHQLTQQRLANKDKEGYRKANEFQPFTPDIILLVKEIV